MTCCRPVSVPALLLLAASLEGCYLAHVACGQLRVLAGSRPVRDVLEDPAVPASLKSKLRFALEVREFGGRVMGLPVGNSCTRFFEVREAAVSHIVSACPKDRFEPHTWWFPVVGRVPYKGFFDRDGAEAEAADLERQRLDVARHEVAAYSTLGWFPDPLFSTLLDAPEEEIAEILLHELTHARLYAAGETDFNESLATFVGRQGTLDFVRRRYGTGSALYGRAVRRFAAEELEEERILALYRRLDDLYRSSLPPERKIVLRDGIAGEPVNNAEILMRRRYGSLEMFRKIYEKAGGDWNLFFAAAAAAIESGNPDP